MVEALLRTGTGGKQQAAAVRSAACGVRWDASVESGANHTYKIDLAR